MADSLNPIVSVFSTTASRLPDFSISDGQLIFVKDKKTIALDLNGKRIFYNQIVVLNTEQERQSLLAPISGSFYFVIENAVLWHYENRWVQITTPPEEIICIGVEMPELGNNKSVYINPFSKTISIWDDDTNDYIEVANKTEPISNEEILSLFINN